MCGVEPLAKWRERVCKVDVVAFSKVRGGGLFAKWWGWGMLSSGERVLCKVARMPLCSVGLDFSKVG